MAAEAQREQTLGDLGAKQMADPAGAALSLAMKGEQGSQAQRHLGLLSQQLVEGLRGLPILILTAGALLLHNAVVLAAEPACLGAGDRWRFLTLGS